MERLHGPYIGLDGAPIPSVTVTVYLANTLTLASLFSDNGVTPKSNPLTSGTDGDFFFYVVNGLYDIKFEKTGMPTKTYEDVRAWDPTDTPVLTSGHLYGLTLSNNAGDATNDIDIAVGTCVADDATATMSLASALTKRIDAAWAVGTGNGGLDIGTLANGTYHLYIIKRLDTNVVDAIFSRNPGRAATVTITIASPGVVTMTDHGLQVGSSVVFSTTGTLPTGITAGTRYFVISAGFTVDSFQISATEGGAAINTSGTQSGTHTATSNPVFPAQYTVKRRIGSVLRESAALVAFTQDGHFFWRKASVLDVNAGNPGTSAVTRTLSVPIGVRVQAIFQGWGYGHASSVVFADFSDLEINDEAAALVGRGTAGNTANSIGGSMEWRVRMSRAGRLRSRVNASDANTVLAARTKGWFDHLGRFYS